MEGIAARTISEGRIPLGSKQFIKKGRSLKRAGQIQLVRRMRSIRSQGSYSHVEILKELDRSGRKIFRGRAWGLDRKPIWGARGQFLPFRRVRGIEDEGGTPLLSSFNHWSYFCSLF